MADDAKAGNPQDVALNLYWSDPNNDYATVTPQQNNLSPDYQPVSVEGYIWLVQRPGTVPLRLYWSAARGDYATVASQQSSLNLQNAGYRPLRREGYVFPP